jgi:hypothetical protein
VVKRFTLKMRRGIEQAGKRRDRLGTWLEYELPNWFGDRVLTVDRRVADRWGRLLGQLGRPAPRIDSILAATALRHELRLVTRTEKGRPRLGSGQSVAAVATSFIDAIEEGKHPNPFVAFRGACGTFAGRR